MFKPTEQQKLAIDTRGSVLITAAAGSGKTAVLVERVVNMLCRKDDPVSIDRLLIVTFTNAAAAEMRGRIEKRLYEESAKNPTDRNLKKQLLLLPSAKICTIDTFCINLVRENFENFGISPDFKIITENELYPIYDAAVNEILDEYYKTDSSRLIALLDSFGCGGDDRRIIEAILKIFKYSTTMPFPSHWLNGCKKMYEEATLSADNIWRPRLIDWQCDNLFDTSEDNKALCELAPHVITLLELVERFAARVFEVMCEKNMLTFYNTEQMALSLLCSPDGTPTEQANILSENFYEILVDEYQDVNDLQDTLFYILSSCGKKLFAVGDVKQSIYGFRGANPENFMRKKDSYSDIGGEGGKKIALAANFRSRNGVCEYINYLFSLTMSRRFGGVEYEGDERLISAATFPKNEAPAAELHLLNTADGEDKEEKAEAKHIAAYIKKVMSEKPFLRKGDELREAKPGDFAILMRSPADHAEAYIKELNALGIPVRYQAGNFLESREIMYMLALLRVLDNPTNDVPLMSLMLSPIFGFTPDDVAKIRISSKKGNLYSAFLLAEREGNARVAAAIKQLRDWRRMAATMSVDRLISRLYDETGLLDIVLSMDDGSRRNANLLLLLQIAREYCENGGKASGFPRYVEHIGDKLKPPADTGDDAVTIMSFHGSKGLQFPICIIAGSFRRFNKADSTASLVMDRHLGVAFKGVNPVENTRRNTVAREAISRAVAEENLSEELRILYVALTRAEERLLITLTAKNHAKKAADMLKAIKEKGADAIVSSAGKYYDWFLLSLIRGTEFSSLHKALGIEVPKELLCSGANAEVWLGAPEEADSESEKESGDKSAVDYNQIVERIEFKYPFSECVFAKAKTSVSEIVSGESAADYDFSARPAFLSKGGLTPAQRGTATHKFMQFANYFAANDSVKDELHRLEAEHYIFSAEAEAADIEKLEKFFKSPLYSRMMKAELHREMRFITELPVGDGEYDSTVVQGVIDCVIDEGDTVSVIDFKTDRVSSGEELSERYGKQLMLYRDACEKLFGRPVKDMLIYSFHLGETIEI